MNSAEMKKMKMVALVRGALLGLVLMTGPAVGQEAAEPATPAPEIFKVTEEPISAPATPAAMEVKAEATMQAPPVIMHSKIAAPDPAPVVAPAPVLAPAPVSTPVSASTPVPASTVAQNPLSEATITLKPHNVRFDKTLIRHQGLMLQYIAESSQVDALVQRTLGLQHRASLIERDLREARYVLSDTRSRKTKAALTEKIAKWEEELASIGDDAQLANIDMQSALQKQQQTLQTMSNVSKILHDTAMAVIRKIGG
jgi:hypothetical protein